MIPDESPRGCAVDPTGREIQVPKDGGSALRATFDLAESGDFDADSRPRMKKVWRRAVFVSSLKSHVFLSHVMLPANLGRFAHRRKF